GVGDRAVPARGGLTTAARENAHAGGATENGHKKGESTDRGRDGPPTHQTGLPGQRSRSATIFALPRRGCATDISPPSRRVNHEPGRPARPFHQPFSAARLLGRGHRPPPPHRT